uniref:Small glutamine-rich tetratricopeptide repeat-containing protein n=1 Tax=Elaeis guineensis var. tenera TaxID=51953 RepID=A0A6I9QM91_ELAGV|nr:small glutamine-rich tetratricopeptide repeat-containing protein [Elaeis guineensis]
MRSDSPTARRIVLAFLDFLKSVELAPGADSEALDVVRECLQEVFKVNSSTTADGIQPGFLSDLFASQEAGEQHSLRPDRDSVAKSCATSSSQSIEDSKTLKASTREDSTRDSDDLGSMPRDELFGRFYAALDKINFFTSSPGSVEDPDQIAKATRFFNEAVAEIGNSQGQIMNLGSLAEAFKSKGNQSMQMKLYSEAIELYTCAIAVCEKNAVYYCNRAAAYTQIHRYDEAIEDCLKSSEIDPNYSKAYSRLGSAYFAKGNYNDALNKGYLKALQLDPGNNAVRENIQVCVQKLMEQRAQADPDQNTRSHHGQESTSHSGSTNSSFSFPSFPFGASPDLVANILRNMTGHGQQSTSQSAGSANSSVPFTSFPVNIPPEIANMIGNIAEATQGHQGHERMPNGNVEGSNEPGIRLDANINLDIGDSPEQVSDVLRSMMEMFSPQLRSQGGMPRGSDQAQGTED